MHLYRQLISFDIFGILIRLDKWRKHNKITHQHVKDVNHLGKICCTCINSQPFQVVLMKAIFGKTAPIHLHTEHFENWARFMLGWENVDLGSFWIFRVFWLYLNRLEFSLFGRCAQSARSYKYLIHVILFTKQRKIIYIQFGFRLSAKWRNGHGIWRAHWVTTQKINVNKHVIIGKQHKNE